MRRRASWLLLLSAFTGAVLLVRVRLGPLLEPAVLLARLRAAGETGWGLPLFVLAYVAGTSLLVPSVLFHVVAGAAWGFERAVVLNLVLANTVSNLQFWVGRRLGRERVGPWLERRGWTRVLGAFRSTDALAMAIIRQLPLPFLGVNLAAGTTPMRWREFLLGSGLGLVPQVLVYTSFAAAIAEGVEGARAQALREALLAGAALIGVGVGSRWLTGWWRKREAA